MKLDKNCEMVPFSRQDNFDMVWLIFNTGCGN